MKLTAHSAEHVFEDLKAEWNSLLHRSANDRIFSTWEWQSNWWAAYHPGELWVITCRTDDDQLVGIAPWFVQTHALTDESAATERIVRGIGCVDVTDYVDLIIDPHHLDAVYQAFARFAAENHAHYDRINLCNIPHNSPTYAQFPPLLAASGFTAKAVQQEVCPTIHLPATWDAYLEQTLDKKNRHELRRKLRRGADREVAWYIVDDTHTLAEQLDIFLRLMAASQPEKAAFLQNPQHRAFFLRVMPVMYACGWLQLAFLTLDGEPVASYLNFDYNQHVLVYNSGLAMQFGEASPGIVLLAHLIRHAIARGYRVFDFLRGNEDYKYRFGAVDAPVYMLLASYENTAAARPQPGATEHRPVNESL